MSRLRAWSMKGAFTVGSQILYEDHSLGWQILSPHMEGEEIGTCRSDKSVRVNGGIQCPVPYTHGMYNTW